MARPCLRAASKTSAPCSASSALLAVTTSLPAASRSSTARRAQSTPPTSSTASWIDGSLSTARRSVVTSSRGKAIDLDFAGSRTTTRRSLSPLPARAASRSGCSSSNRATPLPTVPQPISAMPSGSIRIYPSFPRRAWEREPLRHELLEVTLALPQRAFAIFKRSLERPVFHFDAYRSGVAGVGQR